jgi:hypothetical protein
MRFVGRALLLCGCATVEIVPSPGEGGGGATRAPGAGASGVGASSSEGGGGSSPTPTLTIDIDLPPTADANTVVVLLSSPEGNVKETFLGGELPAAAAADAGDLVTFFHTRAGSTALTYRVTPATTEVRSRPWIPTADAFCAVDEPMTLVLDVPEVPGANSYDLRLNGAFNPMWQVDPGLNEVEVRVCPGTDSFDLVLVVQEYSNTDPIAVARVDGIPYADGSVTNLSIELTSERELVEIEVEGEPGTSFGSLSQWYHPGFGPSGFSVETQTTHTIGGDGTASLSDGPFALGAGVQRMTVSVPPPYFNCELELVWKQGPFDGSPLVARFGALDGFAPQADGNVALALEGETGDVMLRTEDDYASDTPSYWALYEDPTQPYPLPEKPEAPLDLLPSFVWPGPGAELRYIHYDYAAVDGYPQYASTAEEDGDGRALHRVPAGCF